MILDQLPMLASASGSLVTKNYVDVIGSASTEGLVGGERRKMEKQLRLARVSAVLLGSYDKYKETQRPHAPAPSRGRTEPPTPQDALPEVDEQLLDAVAQLAPGIPKHQLVRWALDLIKQQGFAESYREQVSMDFMLIQAVDVTAFVIQRAWRAYVERKSRVDMGLMAHMLDDTAFGWSQKDGGAAPPSSRSPGVKSRKKGDQHPEYVPRERKGSFIDKTFSTKQREEVGKTERAHRRSSLSADVGAADDYIQQAKAAMAKLQKPPADK